LLLPMDEALADWNAVHLDADSSYYIRMGQAVLVPKAPTEGWVRIYDDQERFIGMGEILDDGRVAPRRMLASAI
jgi:tRNA pseudouridine55 synthase